MISDIDFSALDGEGLHGRVSKAAMPQAALLMVHGLQSNSFWFDRSSETLAERGVTVFSYDRRGAGTSGGPRGHAKSPEQLLQDLAAAHAKLRELVGAAVPVHILANCFGARVAIPYLMQEETAGPINSVILTAPGTHMADRADLTMLEKMRVIAPSLIPTERARQRHAMEEFRVPLKDEYFISEGPNLQWIRDDSQSHSLRKATRSFYRSAGRLTIAMKRGLRKLELPCFVMLSSRDLVVENSQIEAFFEGAFRGPLKLKTYESEHMLEFGPAFDEYAADVESWVLRDHQTTPLNQREDSKKKLLGIEFDTGGELVAEELVSLGVDTVYGLPGVHSLELYDSLRERRELIRHITVTQEVSAAHMADGYARVTGRPGVLIVVPGPGVTNALTGLLESRFNGVAVLLLTAYVANAADGFRFHSHECDLTGALEAVCKSVHTVPRRSEIREAIRMAYAETMAGRPGPVAVQIQFNQLDATKDTDVGNAPGEVRGGGAGDYVEAVTDATLQEVAALLTTRRPILYLGSGCSAAADEVGELQKLLQCPFSTTASGKGVLPESHEFALGFGFGGAGSDELEETYKEAEVVLALGCQFSEFATASYSSVRRDQKGKGAPSKASFDLIHVNIEPAHLVKDRIQFFDSAAIGRAIGIAADVKDFVAALNARLAQSSPPAKWEAASSLTSDVPRSPDSVSPACFFRSLNEVIKSESLEAPVFSVDAGEHQLWAVQGLKVEFPRSFLINTNNQSMGFAVPAMLGAMFALPERWGFTIVGDGCLLYTGLELLNAAREKVQRMVIFVFKDGAYAEIALFQEFLTSEPYGIDVPDLDLEKLAAAMGLAYVRIANDTEIESKLREAIAYGRQKTVLVECGIRYPTIFDEGQAILRERFTQANRARRKQDHSLARIGLRRAFSDPLGSLKLFRPRKG